MSMAIVFMRMEALLIILIFSIGVQKVIRYMSQRPTKRAPDLGQALCVKVIIQLPQAGNANR
jgi:hypothetical protein